MSEEAKKVNLEIRNAIKAGDVNRVVDLIGSDVQRLRAMTPFGSWLHVAAEQGKLDIVQKLVALGIDVNLTGGFADSTAIHVAASNGHGDVVRYLISCQAELNASGPEMNPLFAAIREGKLDIVKMLVDAGADLHPKYRTGRDPVSFAKERGQQQIADYLAERISQS